MSKEKNSAQGNKKANFTKAEKSFLLQQEACRVATCFNDKPHVTPVSYIFDGDNNFLYFATDYDSKKFKNLKRNNSVSVAIDVYKSSTDNSAVIVEGTAEFIEQGDEFRRLYDLFYKRFEWVRKDQWKEGEAPFVKINPISKISWGLEVDDLK
jgi:uncharacterized protein